MKTCVLIFLLISVALLRNLQLESASNDTQAIINNEPENNEHLSSVQASAASPDPANFNSGSVRQNISNNIGPQGSIDNSLPNIILINANQNTNTEEGTADDRQEDKEKKAKKETQKQDRNDVQSQSKEEIQQTQEEKNKKQQQKQKKQETKGQLENKKKDNQKQQDKTSQVFIAPSSVNNATSLITSLQVAKIRISETQQVVIQKQNIAQIAHTQNLQQKKNSQKQLLKSDLNQTKGQQTKHLDVNLKQNNKAQNNVNEQNKDEGKNKNEINQQPQKLLNITIPLNIIQNITPNITVTPPTPNITVTPPTPNITVTPPTPNITVTPPTPNITVTPPTPNITVTPPTPNITVTPPTPNITVTPPTPNITVTPPTPNITVTPPTPNITVTPPTPNITVTPPTPNITVTPPTPNITVTPPTPNITVTPPTPNITVTPPTPNITVTPPTPNITVTPPTPNITVTPPTPNITVTPPTPNITVTPPTPNITVTPPTPNITITLRPNITVSPPTPNITVTPTPNITVAPPTPNITVTPPTPNITVTPPTPNITVTPPTPNITITLRPNITVSPPTPNITVTPPTPNITVAPPTPNITITLRPNITVTPPTPNITITLKPNITVSNISNFTSPTLNITNPNINTPSVTSNGTKNITNNGSSQNFALPFSNITIPVNIPIPKFRPTFIGLSKFGDRGLSEDVIPPGFDKHPLFRKVNHNQNQRTLIPQILQLKNIVRTFDGSENNLLNRNMGKTNTGEKRHCKANFADGASTPFSNLPSPRNASDEIGSIRKDIQMNQDKVTLLFTMWGQFIDHDIQHTPANENQVLHITIPRCDKFLDTDCNGTRVIPFSRSIIVPGSRPRIPINAVSTWVDASMVYGSSQEQSKKLRQFKQGKLKTDRSGGFLPAGKRVDTAKNALLSRVNTTKNITNQTMEAGDLRSNENLVLLSLQTIFLRQHNRVCQLISRLTRVLTDQDIYTIARNYVTGLIQKITYDDYLPILLGDQGYNKFIGPYKGYDQKVDATIQVQFSTAGFRFGHSLLVPFFPLVNIYGDIIQFITLDDTLFRPDLMTETNLDRILRGVSRTVTKLRDGEFVDQVRNLLILAPEIRGIRMDLLAINIQRGRDHGLPGFNALRECYGLKRFNSFDEISDDKEKNRQFRKSYSSINDVDSYIGIQAQKDVKGSILGETGIAIVGDQFKRLRNGDRFWYESVFPPEIIAQIKSTHLSHVILRNTAMFELQENVFKYVFET